MMLSFRLDGASFETADVRDLNDWHAKLNGAWRNLANDHLAVWHHLIRRADDRYPEGQFRSAFAAELDQASRARIGATQMFVNELYVTLVLHPGQGAQDKAQAAASRLAARFGRKADAADTEAERIKLLTDAGRDLAQYLGRYGPTPLGLTERDDLF